MDSVWICAFGADRHCMDPYVWFGWAHVDQCICLGWALYESMHLVWKGLYGSVCLV